MAKLRKKFNTKGFSSNIDNNVIGLGDYLYKSGVLTKDFKKIKFDQDLSFSFFNNEVLHSNKGYDSNIKYYHDDHTIFFTEKTVCPTVRLESKYLSNNALSEVSFYNTPLSLNTPNIPQFYEPINANNTQVGISRFEHPTLSQTSKIYDRMLKPNYLESESVVFKETDDIIGDRVYNTITIDYNLNKNPNSDIYLSFSKRNISRRVVFPDNTEFNTFNGNIVYLYNDDFITSQQGVGPYDYLGNISKDYREDINTFINDSHIAFNSFTMEYDSNIRQNDNYSSMYNNSILPIDNFGFPYSSKYKAEDRHLIPAAKYITKPFVVEKIKVECLITNKSFVRSPSFISGSSTEYTYPSPCLNFVNFFVVNQRGSLNTASINHSVENNYYDKDEATLSKITKSDYVFSDNATFTLNNRTNNQVFNTTELFEISNNNPSYINKGNLEGVDRYVKNSADLRDLIGFASIANYSSGGNPTSEFINTIALKGSIDKFIDKSEDPKLVEENLSECLYENLPISIETNVKRYFENKNLPSFSRFRTYPTKSNYNRSNIELTNNRSLHSENASNSTTSTTLTDGVGRNINIRSEYSENCGYILMPEDNLFVGISLSNSAFTQEDLNNNSEFDDTQYQLLSDTMSFGNDLVKISCTDDYPFKIHLIGYYLEDENKKIIKNKEIKSYKNTKKIGYGQNEVVDQLGSNQACLEQNYYDRDFIGSAGDDVRVGINSSDNRTSLGNFFEIPNEISSSDVVFSLYNKYRYGHFADRLNSNYIDVTYDKRISNISKKFKKGYFKEKVPATISGKIVFDFTKLSEFKGTNYLKEVIMTSLTNKQSGSASLILNIQDNASNNIYLQILTGSILDPAEGESTSNLYLINESIGNKEVIITEVPSDISNGFIKNQDGSYDSDLNLLKRNFVDLVARAINNINQVAQKKHPITDPPTSKDFRLNVSAEVVLDSIPTDRIEVKVTLLNRGYFNNANISNYYLNSGVTIQNFEVEEGDIINSYNTDINASFNASSNKASSFQFYDV